MAVPVNNGQGVIIELNVALNVACDDIAETENSSLLNSSRKYYLLNTQIYVGLWIRAVVKTSHDSALLAWVYSYPLRLWETKAQRG